MIKTMFKYFNCLFSISILLTVFIACKEEKSEKIYHYPNGETYKVQMINGKKQGEMIEYYQTGEIKSKSQFINDVQTGRMVRYFKNGAIREVQYFEGNKQQNGDTTFYENGNLQFIVEYTDGIKNGYVKKYDSTGTMYFNAKYRMDTLIEVKGVPLQK